MKLGAFEINEPLPELREPHALVMLQPWIDVGDAGTMTISWLEKHFSAIDLGKLARPGEFFDFTRYRPTSYYEDDKRRLKVPNVSITYTKRSEGHDFLFFHLLEPHNNGEVFVESVLQVLSHFGVKRYCQVGSMYDYVPHTRPLLISGGGNGEKVRQELEKLGLYHPSTYTGPTSIVSLVSQAMVERGMETMSLMIHLPQYTQLEEDYLGAVGLMKVLSSLYDVPIGSYYLEKAKQQTNQLNQALEKDPQLKIIVEQLETRYEADERLRQERAKALSPEIEQFLSEMEKKFRQE